MNLASADTPNRPEIDVERPSTWPAALGEVVAAVAPRYAGTQFAGDIWLTDHEAAAIEDELAGLDVVGYHASRLLEHELEAIAREGMPLLDRAFLERKVASARDRGHLTEKEARILLAEHAALDNRTMNRAGKVCAVVPRGSLDSDPGGVAQLLAYWGGEALYWAHEKSALGPTLRRIGCPAVVAVRIPAVRGADYWSKDVPALLVGVAVGAEEVLAEVHVRTAVPPTAVVAVWTPGHHEYDRHRALPRT